MGSERLFTEFPRPPHQSVTVPQSALGSLPINILGDIARGMGERNLGIVAVTRRSFSSDKAYGTIPEIEILFSDRTGKKRFIGAARQVAQRITTLPDDHDENAVQQIITAVLNEAAQRTQAKKI